MSIIKKIFLLLFLTVLSYANSVLDPKDAFKETVVTNDNGAALKITLGEDIYLYHGKLKVIITKPKEVDITDKIKLPTPVEHHETLVHFNELTLNVSKEMLESAFESKSYEVAFKYQGCSNFGVCYQPMERVVTFGGTPASSGGGGGASETDTIAQTLSEGNIFIILATFFGFGLLLSLTPCVFPMIPILSSIIVSQSGEGQKMSAGKGLWLSAVYVLAMSLAYTIAGVVAGLFGANLQASLQNPIVLIVFAGIFIALAFSMFGYYKIELPHSIQNKINQRSAGKEKGGVIGVAIMGFLSALIVGPCVAPPLAGALVYIGQTGDAVLGGAALFVMSIGMGLPLLAIGVGAGKFMPKPGGWMDSVSKAFGVIMLGVAIWMIERIIPAMATMVLWSLLFMGSALYLFTRKRKITYIFAALFFFYGFLLALGAGSGGSNPINPLEYVGKEKVKGDKLVFQKVKTVAELKSIVSSSKKPIMLDFYADWCISCKELEQTTFKDNRVIEALKNYTLLKVDTTANSDEDKALLKMFNLFGPPGIIFWKEGKELESKRVVGYKNGDEFLAHIKSL